MVYAFNDLFQKAHFKKIEVRLLYTKNCATATCVVLQSQENIRVRLWENVWKTNDNLSNQEKN